MPGSMRTRGPSRLRLAGFPATLVAATVAGALLLAAIGCKSLPAARIGPSVALASARRLPLSYLHPARGFATVRVDDKVAGVAVGRRESFIADAKKRGLDAASLARAFEVASAVSSGTAAIPAAVMPARADGDAAWLIVQAWGYKGKTTDKARAWLIDAKTGDLLASVSGSP